MPLSRADAWDDLIRRAKTAGVIVRHNHAGIAVLERAPEPKPEDAAPPPGAVSAESDARAPAPELALAAE